MLRNRCATRRCQLCRREIFSSFANLIFPFSTAIFTDIASQEIKNIIPDPMRRVRTTRSSTHSHSFQVTLPNPRTLAHKSSFISRTSQLWNSFYDCHPLLSLNPIICHLLNLASTNLILSPFLLSLPHFLSFSFAGALLEAIRPFPDITY